MLPKKILDCMSQPFAAAAVKEATYVLADPAAFFTPLDKANERWHELNAHPNWLFHGKDYPSRKALLAQRNRVIAKHPKTTFIGAHLGNNPEDLKTVGHDRGTYLQGGCACKQELHCILTRGYST